MANMSLEQNTAAGFGFHLEQRSVKEEIGDWEILKAVMGQNQSQWDPPAVSKVTAGMNLTLLAYVDASCLEQSGKVVQTECLLLAGAPPPRADWMQIQAAGSRPISSWLSKYCLCLSEKHFLLVTAQHI